MYPDLLSLYGDRGNLICLQKRLEWQGFDCRIIKINVGNQLDLTAIDMIFMSGAPDREQRLVYHDLIQWRDQLSQQINDGLPTLCIGGAYQLLGEYYKSDDGGIMEGLGLFPFITSGQPDRLMGDILLESQIDGETKTLVGFENHSGRTYFNHESLQPLGKVIKGYGNNGEDKTEGVWFQNLIGTYLQGSLLPKNPHLADFFIQAMAYRRGISLIEKLDDSIENIAHEQVRQKIISA